MSALKQMATAMASRGRGGDRYLVHVNDREMDEMRDRWGEPTINPDTGLPEFFLGGVLDAITSIIQPVAQIASSVLPFFAPDGGVQQPSSSMSGLMPGVRNQQTGQYVMSPPVQLPSSSGGALSRLLGGSFGQNLLPAALMTALDYFSQPDIPSVAEQLAEINAAQAAANPHWATPLPDVEYDRQSASPPAGYDFGVNPEFSFFTNNQLPTVKKAYGGGIYKPVTRPVNVSEPREPLRRLAGTFPVHLGPRKPLRRLRSNTAGTLPVDTREPPHGWPGIRKPGLSLGMNEGGMPEMRAAGRMYHGPGGGQSDLIPAMVSDGEYVIDSNTVADLGDGNPDEGARKLDGLRDAVARQKGREKRVPPKAHGNIAKYLRAA